jgi:deazaflavin-dependent oxidoreductase (nitroreductase family)
MAMAKRRKGAGRALLISGMALAGFGVGLGLALANRDKLPANIRDFNKRYMNPLMMRLGADGKRRNFGIIIHRGRTSGREYRAPVRMDPIPDGFLVPMPYGTNTDWLKNILAAQGATVHFRGHDIAVDQPEIIDAATAQAMLSPFTTRVARLIGIKHYMRLHRADLPLQHVTEESLTEDRPTR